LLKYKHNVKPPSATQQVCHAINFPIRHPPSHLPFLNSLFLLLSQELAGAALVAASLSEIPGSSIVLLGTEGVVEGVAKGGVELAKGAITSSPDEF